MENPAPLPEVVAWMGLDWADERHQISLQGVGESQAQSFSVEQKPEALHAWIAELRARFSQGKIAVALKQSRGAVIAALMNYDFLLLYPIQPKTLARYREAFICSGAKSDASDADLLRELVRAHRDRLRLWQPDDALTRQLRLLVEHRRHPVAERTRLSNRLTLCSRLTFPKLWNGPEIGVARPAAISSNPGPACKPCNRPAARSWSSTIGSIAGSRPRSGTNFCARSSRRSR